jgi:hypothetical protein
MADPPHTDFYVDPYLDDRTFNPEERSTFWRKWVARNPYYRYMELNVLQGYVGDDYDDLESRTYLIDKINIGNKGVSIIAKDPLILVSQKQAQAPRATGGMLTGDIDDSVNTFVAGGCLEGEYPTAGIIRVNEEVMTYTGASQTDDEVTFTGVSRGEYGTEASEHDEEDRVQICLKYTEELVHEIIYDLMTEYAEVPEEYIDYYEWEAESVGQLSLYIFTGLITEPTGVDVLIGEILEGSLAYVYWHETEKLLKLKAYRPPATAPAVITEEKDIIAGSIEVTDSPESRINQVWLFWNQKDPTSSLADDNNWARLRIRVLGDDPYQDRNVRKIYSRWISDDAQALDITSKLLARFQTPIKKITASLLDNTLFWTGDYIAVETKKIVDAYGLPLQASCEIVSAEKRESIINYLFQSYAFVTPAVVPVPDNMVILSLNALFGYQLCDGTAGTLDLIGKFLKAYNQQGSTGGSETHQHDDYEGDTGSPEMITVAGSGISGEKDHTHSIDHSDTPTENNPAHKTVIPYKATGNLTASMLMFYIGAIVPDGWEIQDSFFDKYIKCVDTGGNQDNGDNEHSHVHNATSGNTTPTAQPLGMYVSGSVAKVNANHNHNIDHIHVLTTELIYYSVTGVCAFFFGNTPPDGWSVYDEASGRFLKGAEVAGNTGGTVEHNHEYEGTSGSSGGDGINKSPGLTPSAKINHLHTIDHTHSTENHEPPYQELMFCRKDSES